MKTIKLLALTLALPIASFATGLNFNTYNPSLGDILKANGSKFGSTDIASFGTLSSTLGDFSTLSSNFTSLGTSNFTAAGELLAPTTMRAPSTVSPSTAIFILIDSSDGEQGVFSMGTTPTVGLLSATPSTMTAIHGSDTGINLNTVVPEPSTYAMLAGALALGYVMIRRRK